MKELYRFRQFLTENEEEDLILDRDYDKGGKYYSEDGAEAFRIQPFKLNDIEYTKHEANRMGRYIVGLEGEELKKFISDYMGAFRADKGDTEPGRTFKEGVIKENMSLEANEDFIELSADSGDYFGDLNDDGTVDFSVTYDYFEEGFEDFDEYNWKDILGPKHAFVQISNQIPTKVEAVADYVMITVDLEDLKKLLK